MEAQEANAIAISRRSARGDEERVEVVVAAAAVDGARMGSVVDVMVWIHARGRYSK